MRLDDPLPCPAGCMFDWEARELRPKYWQLPCEVHTTARQAKAALVAHEYLFTTTVKSERHIQLNRRAARGLISYEKCSISNLRQMITSKGLELPDFKGPGTKRALITVLEAPDDGLTFHRFMDLPPELRIGIYGFHYTSFVNVTLQPPPLLAVSSVVRREARLLFYESNRFMIRIHAGLVAARMHVAEQHFLESLDDNCLARINKLRVVYLLDYMTQSQRPPIYELNIAETDEKAMGCMKQTPFYADHGSKQTMTELFKKMIRDTQARPQKHRMQREDVKKLYAYTVPAALRGR